MKGKLFGDGVHQVFDVEKDIVMSQRLGFIGTLMRQDLNVRLLFFRNQEF